MGLDGARLRRTICAAMGFLVTRDYTALESLTGVGACLPNDMARAVGEHPHRLAMPPTDGIDELVDWG